MARVRGRVPELRGGEPTIPKNGMDFRYSANLEVIQVSLKNV